MGCGNRFWAYHSFLSKPAGCHCCKELTFLPIGSCAWERCVTYIHDNETSSVNFLLGTRHLEAHRVILSFFDTVASVRGSLLRRTGQLVPPACGPVDNQKRRVFTVGLVCPGLEYQHHYPKRNSVDNACKPDRTLVGGVLGERTSNIFLFHIALQIHI